MSFRVTACTTMGHLLDMSHRPETLDSARRWAKEIAGLPGIQHVVIVKEENFVVESVKGSGGDESWERLLEGDAE